MESSDETRKHFFYIPSGKGLRYASLGHRSLLASMLWVRGMFYFADVIFDEGKPTLLDPLLLAVIELDPEWRYPYEFGGLVLENGDGIPSETALDLLRKGVDRFGEDWRLRVYLAMALRAAGGDPAEVEAVLLPITQMRVSAPEYVHTLVFTLVGEMSDSRRMVGLVADLARTTNDPMVGMMIQGKIERIVRKHAAGAVSNPAALAQAIFVLLRSDEPQAALGQDILLGLQSPDRKLASIQLANDLLRQFQAYDHVRRKGFD